MSSHRLIARRVLAVAGLVVGLAIAVLFADVWVYSTVKLREGPGMTTPFALLPPAVVLIGDIAVIVALVQRIRHRQSLTTVNIVVWSGNAVSFVLLQLFGAR
jgi:hypothetical protein